MSQFSNAYMYVCGSIRRWVMEITLSKSTCPNGSFHWPGLSGNGICPVLVFVLQAAWYLMPRSMEDWRRYWTTTTLLQSSHLVSSAPRTETSAHACDSNSNRLVGMGEILGNHFVLLDVYISCFFFSKYSWTYLNLNIFLQNTKKRHSVACL